jgi:hydroxymethylbilane synthase
MRLKLGTRPSPLALKQVEEAIEIFRSRGMTDEIEVVRIVSEGDVDKITPLSGRERSDLFTGALEDALISEKIDMAVHSAKDLEDDPPAELVVALTTASISIFETLISRGRYTIDTLPPGSVIGTSSAKRKENILSYRPDLKCRDIRGNIGERIAQLDSGEYDAIIVAHAALIRLGLEERISQILPADKFKPHPLQGILAIQVRREDKGLIARIRGQ